MRVPKPKLSRRLRFIKAPKKYKSWSYRIACMALVFLIIFGTLYFNSGRSKAITDTFTTSGTWTVPANVFSADFEAWGGGGAGGGTSANGSGGSGGAGGQYSIKSAVTTNAGDNYTVTVATTVAGGTGAGATGNDSQVTNPSSTVFIRAKGGAGGAANTGAAGTGSTTNGIGDNVKAGGNGATGTATLSGGGGGGAGSTGNGGNASGTTAGTGTSTNGGNGGAGSTVTAVGNAGNNYGGGGSGAFKSSGGSKAGGGGAQGLVTVTYTVTPPTYDQNSYRLFDNANSLTPGSPLATQNTSAALSSTGQAFRLRQLVKSNITNSASASSTAVIDSGSADLGLENDVAVGADSFARFSYSDGTNSLLKFARCTDAACASKNLTTVDTTSGNRNSLYMDSSDGFARIAYANGAGSTVLKFAQCTNADCTTKNLATVDTVSGLVDGVSVTQGNDGFARIAYLVTNAGVGNIKFAQCTNASCSTKNLTTVDNGGGTRSLTGPSMAIASDNFARMAYFDSGLGPGLVFVQCTNADCSAKNSTTVTTGSGGLGPGGAAVNISPTDGFARISYLGTSSSINFAQCTNSACSSSNISAVDNSVTNVVGLDSVLGSDGYARILYNDNNNFIEKYATCLNIGCTSSSIKSLYNSQSGRPTLALASDDSFRAAFQDYNSTDLYYAYPTQLFNEQFANLSTYGTCSAIPTGNYSAITTSSNIAYNDNSSVTSSSVISTTGNDPTESGQTVQTETYSESDGFYNPSSFGGTVDGMWDLSLKDNGAPASTTYCLRTVKSDNSALDTYTQYPQITTSAGNVSPGAPTLITPAASATNVAFTPQFTLRTTDAENDYIRYRIYLYQSDCSTVVGTSPFNQNSSQTGWSSQDANTGTAYVGNATLTLSTIATYTYQGNLAGSTTYCWKADAVDPGGSTSFGSVSSTQTFTTQAPTPTNIHGNVNIRGNTTIH
jgi:hypothetical protein